MASVCFYFQVHQPYRIKRFRHFDIGQGVEYFSEDIDSPVNNKKVLTKVAQKCYLPTNEVLLKLLDKYPEFRCSFSLTGVLLDQLEEFFPEVITSFQKLVSSGRVEILAETYYHSLSFLHSKPEFVCQIKKHTKKIEDLFGVTPKVFRNTELIYNNSLASFIENMGFTGILTEGADHILQGRNPHFIYASATPKPLPVLLKSYQLSDDVAFRFSEKSWREYPLTAPKFSQWLNAINGNGQLINLFMDYETFGEHQWQDTGIFEFLQALPQEILKNTDNDFVTPSEALSRFPSVGELDVQDYISWADVERDLSAWSSNAMQMDASDKLYALRTKVLKTKNPKLIEAWRRLTTSDHFYYMCTKWFADGDVHKYFNPYDSPYDAFRYFMNVLTDLKLLTETKTAKSPIGLGVS